MSYRETRKEHMKNKIIKSITEYTEANGYPPTMVEIGQMVGLRSKATVAYYLDTLRTEGRVVWEYKKNRTLRVIG